MPYDNPSLIDTCPACHGSFHASCSSPVQFCPLCGHRLAITPSLAGSGTRLGHRYELLESIGKGGMGEVFAAFDTACGRRIALKKIRSDLLDHPQIRRRFLKEAHITCQLTHPAIIPIYSIQQEERAAYYTMPFVEGETLRQIIRKAYRQEKKGEKPTHPGGSIPALMRIFMTICQAVAYAHARGVLHRDLKPENIIVGKYGEVLILDWGLAKSIREPRHEEISQESPCPTLPFPGHTDITQLGKVVGTVAYMAPERALGQPATLLTDIYSLGVILYQLLTLRPPFKRGTLSEFRQNLAGEKWIDPVIAAPYRDVPRMLARCAETCTHVDPAQRYPSVDALIQDLENYLEGRSEWFPVAELDTKKKTDWEFQEHVLLAQHTAITRTAEESEWVNLMISAQSFAGNTRIETIVRLGDHGRGIGILFSIPESTQRTHMDEGYRLWLGSDSHRSTKLLRSHAEVMHAPDIFLQRNCRHRLRIEQVDKSIHFYLDDVLQFSYSALLPLIGTHVGLLSRDADFEIEPLKISVGSLNLTVNCLAVPDAFLAHRQFAAALSEYRRIAYSFPDRAEGREALFRAGLTFLEQSKGAEDKTHWIEQALNEFEKLHGTPGAPLEYLGKALVYQNLNESDEEIKCFELAYRRYPKHPLLSLLQEHILSRMHEVSRRQRRTTYQFIFLALRHLPPSAVDTHTRRLFSSLQKHWEILPFMEEPTCKSQVHATPRFTVPLAFWLAQPYMLSEILDELSKNDPPSPVDIRNALAALIELGAWQYAQDQLHRIERKTLGLPPDSWEDIRDMLTCHQGQLERVLQRPLTPDFPTVRARLYALDQALHLGETALIHAAMPAVQRCELSADAQLRFNVRRIWAFLLEKEWRKAGEAIYTYPVEMLNKESSPLYFLYGCWLQGTNERELAEVHFSGLLHMAYPRSWTLASHELSEGLLQRGWTEKAFLWEKRELYKQLALYYRCAGEEGLNAHYLRLYNHQFIASNLS